MVRLNIRISLLSIRNLESNIMHVQTKIFKEYSFSVEEKHFCLEMWVNVRNKCEFVKNGKWVYYKRVYF